MCLICLLHLANLNVSLPFFFQKNIQSHSNKVFTSDPGDPIEFTAHHYPYLFLTYSSSFWPGKPFLCPKTNHFPGLLILTAKNSVHFTNMQTISMTWMMKIITIGVKLSHTPKPPMLLKLLIWGSIDSIQSNATTSRGDKSPSKDLHWHKLIQNLLLINFPLFSFPRFPHKLDIRTLNYHLLNNNTFI